MTKLDPKTRASLASMIRDGWEPEKVVDLIWSMGYLNGGLDMAQIGTDRVVAETAAALRHLQ